MYIHTYIMIMQRNYVGEDMKPTITKDNLYSKLRMLLQQPQFCSAPGMFALAQVSFAAIMRRLSEIKLIQ